MSMKKYAAIKYSTLSSLFEGYLNDCIVVPTLIYDSCHYILHGPGVLLIRSRAVIMLPDYATFEFNDFLFVALP